MKLIRLIASPMLMYVLAGVYALVLAIATFVENSSGPALAREYFYYAPWFILLQVISKESVKEVCSFMGLWFLFGWGRLLLTMQE